MQFNLHLAGRAKLFLAGIGALVLLLVLFIAARSLFQSEPTPEELRLRHLEYLVRLVEAYRQRNGVYPQPTARREAREGIRHVWGYEPEKPALASCTVALDTEGNADPLLSRCGGGVYDSEGNLIGWKGTLTNESGLNNVEVAHRGSGRIGAPLSEISAELPMDPAYAGLTDLTTSGFGEYVYAVRIPQDGAQNKGGIEYQIAVTDRNPESDVRRTHIRGTYFVKSDERDALPASLIGPGLLFDEFGNPIGGQTRSLHVLLDGQREGYPNPALGEGEETLRALALQRRAQRLLRAIGERADVMSAMPTSSARSASSSTLTDLKTSVESILSGVTPGADLAFLEAELTEAAVHLAQAMEAFLGEKRAEVQTVLRLETGHRETAAEILRGALSSAAEAEEVLLFARDEVLKYLDGAGIEDQTRARVGRKLEDILRGIPDLKALFAAANLSLPTPFLPEKLSRKLEELAARESQEIKKVGPPSAAIATGSGAAAQRGEPAVMISTVVADLLVFFEELGILLAQIQEDVRNISVPMENIDESLRKLTRALTKEHERIGGLFENLADTEMAGQLSTLFGEEGNVAHIASLSMQHGDFSPLLFDPTLLDAVILERSPGIPDTGAREHASEAEYRGIPYPLP